MNKEELRKLQKDVYPVEKRKFDYLCNLFGIEVLQNKDLCVTGYKDIDNGKKAKKNYNSRTYKIEDKKLYFLTGTLKLPKYLLINYLEPRNSTINDTKYNVSANISAPEINLLIESLGSDITQERYRAQISWYENGYDMKETKNYRSIEVCTRCENTTIDYLKSIDMCLSHGDKRKLYTLIIINNALIIKNEKTGTNYTYNRIDDKAIARLTKIIMDDLKLREIDHSLIDLLPILELITDYIDSNIPHIIYENRKEIYAKELALKNRA